MNSGRSPRAIDEAWQQELDLSLETGESPLFDVGASTGGLEGMNGVLALWRMDAGRRDLTAPVVTAGGMSGAWLAALHHVRPDDTPVRSPAIITAYTAPDIATHMAGQTLWDTRRSAFRRRPADVPPWAHGAVVPEALPGAPAPWETLPLSVTARNGGRDGWLAWAGVVLAVALLLIAVLA